MIIRQKDCVLYILAIWPAHADNLGRGISDKLLHRAGEVWLIEITRLKNSVEDRTPLLEERRRPLGALELTDMVLGQAGSSQETMSHRAGGYLRELIL